MRDQPLSTPSLYTGPVKKLTKKQNRAAMLTVCELAPNKDDAKMLMMALGLIPDPEAKLQMTRGRPNK